MTVTRDNYTSRTLPVFNWHTVPVTATQRYPEITLERFAGKVDRVLLSREPHHFKAHHFAEIAHAVTARRSRSSMGR